MKNNPRILVVDDDANLRKTLSDILRIKGYEIAVAANGAEAIAASEREIFSLALIDLMLPDMPGLEVMARIKAISPLTEAIILTGNASMDTAIEATRQGAYSYLLKPYQMDDLLRNIGHGIERQQAQVEIRRLSEALRQSHEAIAVTDVNSHFEYVNPAFTKLLGYTIEDLKEQSIDLIGVPGDTGTGPLRVTRIATEQGEFAGETLRRAKDGRAVPVLLNVAPICDERGRITNYVGTMTDITALKHAEAAVLQLNAELEEKVIARTASLELAKLEVEQASRGKDEFLAAISHELKTPLNHILGFADLLKEGLAGELNAEQKGMAQDIFDAGSKQLAIVNSLIELARLQAGKVKLQAEPEDPARMIGEIATRHAAKAQAAGLAFAVEVQEGLGEIPLDREVVTHLIDQLLANAFKFTPAGGKVSLTARRVPRADVAAPVRIEANEYLELAIADNGTGIAPEILPRLFQPFVQGDGRLARSHQGTGIGLVLVKLLAELHGGGSAAQSEPSAGAKFLVWLPCGTAPTPRSGGEDSPPPSNII